jgi:hypothetical protein
MGVADRGSHPLDPVGDRLGVLDEVGQAVDDPGDDQLIVGQGYFLKYAVFMGVARVGEREEEAADLGLLDDRQNIGERHVAIVRPFVIAPADVQAHPVARNVFECRVDRRDDAFDKAEEIAEWSVLV